MQAVRQLHNEQKSDVSNGYPWRKVFGRGQQLELQVPRSCYHRFYPVLLAVIKNQKTGDKKTIL